MTRKLALLFLLATLPFTACDKVRDKVPFLKKKVAATPAPVPAVAAPAAASTGTAAPTTAVTAPARSNIDTNAQVVVLCYHRLEGKAGGTLSIEPAVFEKQMEAIKESGVAVISMKDFLAWRRGEKTIPPKSILITIDDGYVSGFDVGVPILKKYGFTATFFIYTDYLNRGGKSMTWDQLRKLDQDGFEIGCHTVSHLDLRHKPSKWAGDYDSWLKDELERSKKILEENLGIKCSVFAYPFGLHKDVVRTAVEAAGYDAAFTTYGARLGHGANAFTLGRYDVTAKMAGNQQVFDVALNFTGMAAPSSAPAMAQDAATSMITEPMHNTTTADAMPVVKANLATLGDFEPGSVEMRISGLGVVPAKYDAASKMIEYKVAKPLREGSYTVIIGYQAAGQRRDTRWAFHYSATGEAPPEPATPPTATPKPLKKPVKR
ncbi:MAG: polysaccharide deacetylase family protein [Chthoniobacter sp.]|nr:polysaccharide deacetylase family protein [Chthoniobacter sp.]